ncbi:hypothetical protein GF380_04310 [Candidatus Uhrbacteria bacterium]|nr:hypothetical protein [Candidatus Uhrbacteria bacterium]MBD3284292.1 hypothetical protein [Candidatus Uhrbacteria bacterium]
MFNNNKRPDSPYPTEPSMPSAGGGTPLTQNAATVIARGVKVEGEFKSQGDVVIEGEVHGSINAAGTLTVGPEAQIYANVITEEAVISGAIDGNLTVKKQAVLHASAQIKGDVTAERITVEAGAVMEGKVQIGSPSMPASSKQKQESPEHSKPQSQQAGQTKPTSEEHKSGQ